ncbi:MAG TPA: ribonuclease J [Candidatus Saccharimonadales bacterium]|nr:ribonuclease J [Candidatus Saccharimonadales bacterium]
MQKKPQKSNFKSKPSSNGGRSVSRAAALRAQARGASDAQRVIASYDVVSSSENKPASSNEPRRANVIDDSPRLKIIGLGGMDSAGSRNMILLEYLNDAIVIDCGNDLSVDLPGINYAIPDVSYLESIKHKLRAYVMTHGHLDHIGGLAHIVPKVPAPIYGSRFTIGMVEKTFENFGGELPGSFKLETQILNENTHERIKIGPFFVELIRITHSIPGSTCVVVDTPVGRIINTGDFRFDPNPLDHERTDTDRLKQLGNEGVLALLSESTTSERPGRTPSESILEQTFVDLFEQSPGRIFISMFSSHMNRIQMVVNSAVRHGRKVAFDGRSMMSTLELAVRIGFMKIPKGQVIPISAATKLPDDQVVVICTGAQGEPSSALMRMATGDHRDIKLKPGDTAIISATPIPESGNDRHVGTMVNDLMERGVHVFRHNTREVDHCGPLHVSGHASLEEYGEMIDMTKPKFFIPIYGSYRSKHYHIEEAVNRGIPRKDTLNVGNGEVINLTSTSMTVAGEVPHGTVLVDQTGAIVSGVVIKDRLMLAEEGLVAVVLTIDKKTGLLMTSPDIISRGFIYMRDNEDLMKELRNELRRAVQQRFKRIDIDRFKQEVKEHVTHFLFEQTGRSPIVIPVVNIIGGKEGVKTVHSNGNGAASKTPDQLAQDQQRRFEEMRARLLAQDARTD